MNHAVTIRKTVFPTSVLMEAEAFKRKISTRLYKLRMARKDLVSTVSRAVGISDEMLEKIESGTYNFTVGMLLRLCEYYKVDPNKVVCGR